jgi:hypothetical protein
MLETRRHWEKLASNRLSYGTDFLHVYLQINLLTSVNYSFCVSLRYLSYSPTDLHHRLRLQVMCPIQIQLLLNILHPHDRLCGLVVRVPAYRSIGPGSLPGATRFSEK